MSPDPAIVSGSSSFPSTVWEDLHRAGDPGAPGSRETLNDLAAAYWRPVFHYIRAVWNKSLEDAKDLTQGFFASIFDPEFLAQGDAARGSFRAYVISSLKNFLANEEKARKRLKRGSGAPQLSLDCRDPDGSGFSLALAQGRTPEEYFDRAWAASVLEEAVRTLEKRYAAQGKERCFEVFRLYCWSPGGSVSYRSLSERFEMSSKEIDNAIYAARKEFRRLVVETVRRTVADPALLDDELRRLFGSAR